MKSPRQIDMTSCPCCYYSGSGSGSSGPGSQSGESGVGEQCPQCDGPTPLEYEVDGHNYGGGFPCSLTTTCQDIIGSDPFVVSQVTPCLWRYEWPELDGTCAANFESSLAILYSVGSDETTVTLEDADGRRWEKTYPGRIACDQVFELPLTQNNAGSCVLIPFSSDPVTVTPR